MDITGNLHKKDSLFITFLLLSLVVHLIAGSMGNSGELGTEGNILNLIKNINKEHTTNILLLMRNLKLSPKIKNKVQKSPLTTAFQHHPGSPS